MARRRFQSGCLFIRGKRYKVWVARWREDVILPDGSIGRRQRSEILGLVSEKSKSDAMVLLEGKLAPINQGKHRPKASITFSVFVAKDFKPGILPTLKFSTQQVYSVLLEKHLLPRFGQQRLCDITRAEIQLFVVAKLKEGFSWEHVNKLRNLLSKVLGTAVSWGHLSENPVRGVKMPERTLKRPHSFLTVHEVRRLLTELDGPVRTMVLLATLTGLRIGEIVALRWGRVDLNAGNLRVEETCYKGNFGTPKTRASRREIPLAPVVVEALLAHRSRSRDDHPNALVFSTRNGTPLGADNLRKRELGPACGRAGLKSIDWHTLRHTHGTLLHAQGTPLKVAQAQLGHSRLATTLEIYTHALTDAQREAVTKLEGVLFPNVPNLHQDAAGVGERSSLVQ